MRLQFRPVATKDLAAGFECIRDGFLYDQASKQILLSMWADLLSQQTAVGACIEDLDKTFGRSIVGFGLSAFVRPEFAREIEGGLHPYISVRILEQWRKFKAPLLSAAEIATGNAGDGLNLLSIHSGVPADIAQNPSARTIVDQSEAFLYFGASGYRLKSILMEVYGERQRAEAGGMRYRDRSCSERGLAARGMWPSLEHHPFVVGIDAEEAAQMRGTTLASLYTYAPPVFNLIDLEQELLQFALSGNTDQEIAELLCLSYPAIRKRWDSIYGKVGDYLPHILDQGPDAAGAGRGSEKRRRVLRYVQFHREELRPYPR